VFARFDADQIDAARDALAVRIGSIPGNTVLPGRFFAIDQRRHRTPNDVVYRHAYALARRQDVANRSRRVEGIGDVGEQFELRVRCGDANGRGLDFGAVVVDGDQGVLVLGSGNDGLVAEAATRRLDYSEYAREFILGAANAQLAEF
jgi:hypothetical protein